MSELIQIDIRLMPAYGTGGFKAKFPNLAKFLRYFDYDRVLDEEPSLYYMVDVLRKVVDDSAVPARSKAMIAQMVPEIEKVRDEAREQLLARRLNELDRTLYRLEDLFKDLERETQW